MKRALLLGVCFLLSACSSAPYFRDAGAPPEAPALTLESWPHPDVWTGVVFNGQKIGFTRRQLRAAGAGWEIESEAVMRLQFLGIDKRIRLHSLDRVRPDLTLETFRYEHLIDGNRLFVHGKIEESFLSYIVEAAGSKEEKKLPAKQPLYPSSALALLPAVHGLKVGAQRRYTVFHGETQALSDATQEVQGYEQSALFEGAAFKIWTRLLGLDTTTWIAADGRPLLELGMQGVIISALEDEPAAKRYLVEASLAKNDAVIDFSLMRAGPLAAPRQASHMQIELSGVPRDFVLHNAACERSGERVTCRIDRAAPLPEVDPKPFLRPTLAAPSNLGEIRDLARAITKGSAGDEQSVALLLAWIDANIAKEAFDAFTAADVLRARRAECQGHAYLFAALARAAGVPARIVNGIVYSEQHGGFLFHTWNEAWLAGHGWRAVDATFGQAQADATHVRLIEGESAAELLPLVNLVGRMRVSSVSTGARW